MSDDRAPGRTKRPAFQFYPSDWRNDPGLSLCSLAARGLWIEMMCLMHTAEPYGHLYAAGCPLDEKDLARLVGESPQKVKALVAELEKRGVLSRTEEGVIFSRRMVRDEQVRIARAEGGEAGKEHGHKGAEHGKKGGRPPKERGDKKPPSEPPPSSSSSSSPSELESANADLSAAAPTDDPPEPGDDSEQPIDGRLPCPHNRIIRLYHETLPELRRVREWNDTRKRMLQRRWAESAERQSLDWWREFFGYVRQSPFLMGRVIGRDGRPFDCDLEWLIRPSNFAKVVEGKYEDEAA